MPGASTPDPAGKAYSVSKGITYGEGTGSKKGREEGEVGKNGEKWLKIPPNKLLLWPCI